MKNFALLRATVKPVLIVAFALASLNANAQIPSVSLTGLPVQPLIGEQSCFDAEFSNSDVGTVGYGPYLVATYPPGLTVDSVQFINVNAVIQSLGTFGPSGELIDPISGNTITGAPGGSAYVYRYPIGAVSDDSPTLALTICTSANPSATINSPLPIGITPGFEFGDTATGVNGPITRPEVSDNVTPALARLEKDEDTPGSRRPPGPTHPFTYNLNLDVSNASTIDNVVMMDNLPAQLQWTGTLASDITITAATGTNCRITSTPNTAPTAGGTLTAECDNLTGTAGSADLVVSFEVYVVDILDETAPASTQTITNTVTVNGDYDGAPIAALTYSDTTDIFQSTIIKAVSGGDVPLDNLTYTLSFRLSDYTAGAAAYVIVDEIPDGIAYTGNSVLTINGTAVPITPTVQANTPSTGITRVTWDIRNAFGADLPTSTIGILQYDAQILENYSAPAGNPPVTASDIITNNARADHTLAEGGVSSNPASASITIHPNTPSKRIISPSPIPAKFEPGEEITFRMQMTLPAGSTGDVVLTDFLPLPVIPVSSFNPAPPPAGDWSIPAGGSFLNQNPTAVTINPANNSISFDFGDIETATERTLAVDIKTTIADTPFADNLFLSNLMQMQYDNHLSTAFADLQTVDIVVGAPNLTMTKGVISTDNPNNVISPPAPADPSTALANSNVGGVDAGDTITYLLTVENIGSKSAYRVVVRETNNPKLTCAAAPVSVVNGNGTALTYTGSLAAPGGLVLDAPLAGNDLNPAGGGAPFTNDTALIRVNCTINSNATATEIIANEASVTWRASSTASSDFPAKTDTATTTISSAQPSKSVVAIAPGYKGNLTQVHVGELVTYDVVITVPEGQTPAARLVDQMPAGMATVDVVSITPSSADISTNAAGGFAGAASAATIGNIGADASDRDRLLTIELGDIVNANSDNTTTETLTIRYRARVLNTPRNSQGASLRNQATLSWQPVAGARQSATVRANAVSIVEPQLSVNKTFSTDEGDNSTALSVTLVVQHTASSTADAYDVAIEDILPTNMGVAGGLDLSSCATLPTTSGVTVGAAFDTVNGTWSSFPLGSTCTISFNINYKAILTAGSALENCSPLTWQSLSAANQPLPAPPTNTLATERTGTKVGANDYHFTSCDTFNVYDVGISKQLKNTSQAITDGIAATPAGGQALTIGEEVTFELVTTVPEAAVATLLISDALPSAAMAFEITTINITHIGSDLSPTIPAPIPTYVDQNGDGRNDAFSLDFGAITHSPLDGTDEEDRIRIEVTALVLDLPPNANNDNGSNVGTVRFLGTQSSSDSYPLRIVEPLLNVAKTADSSEAIAGQTLNYRLRVSHEAASNMAASNVSLSDTLPASLQLVAASAIVGATCSDAPDSLTQVGNTVSASWTDFPLGAVCDIEFQVTVSPTAISGSTIVNTGQLGWTSLPGTPSDERTYGDSGTWTLDISDPRISKEMVDTNSPLTPFVLGAPSNPLTIGEEATFDITVDFSDGVTQNVVIEDVLPATGAVLSFVSAEILSIGGDLTIGSGIGIGNTGGACVPASANCRAWNLGNVTNATDLRANPDIEDRLVIRVVAIINNDPDNSGAPGDDDNVVNRANLKTDNGNFSASDVFDIVDPELNFSKRTQTGTNSAVVVAGDTQRFTLRIAHTANSSATAAPVTVTDTLNANMLWVNDANVTSTCPGFSAAAITSSPANGTTGSFTIELPSLPLAQSSCDISYDVEVSGTIGTPGNYVNNATLAWDSSNGSAQNRAGSGNASAVLVTQSKATITKSVEDTSVAATGSNQHTATRVDGTIGELIDYEIVVSFDEGTTSNVVISDSPQNNGAGHLQYVGAAIVSIGSQLNPGKAGTPTEAGGVVTFDFGNVINAVDGVRDANDTIVLRVTARVVDELINTDGDTLTNTANLSFTGSPVGGIDATNTIDVVSPALTSSKDFVSLLDTTATIRLTVENSGTAPAYELTISDELDESYWDPATLTATMIPAGFELVSSSSGGTTTVTIQTLGDHTQSAQVLSAGESIVFEFTVDLQNNGNIGVTTLPNTATISTTTLPGTDATATDNERVINGTANDTLRFPDLRVRKTWTDSNGGNVEPGDIITYTITTDNVGDGSATNVVVTDTPDALGTLVVGTVNGSAGSAVVSGNIAGDSSVDVRFASIASGATATVSYNVQVPSPYPDGLTSPQTMSNQASVDSDQLPAIPSDDPTTVASGDSTVIAITADPIMRVSKNDQVIAINAGGTLVYAITYRNIGNQNATGVVITETVPAHTVFNAASSTAGWSCANGAVAGTSCTFTVIGTVNGGGSGVVNFAVDVNTPLATGIDTLSNSVSITEDGKEFGQPDSAPSTHSATETTPITAAPAFTLNKSDGGVSIAPGQTVIYTLNYSNNGNQDATGVELRETVPVGTTFNAAASLPSVWSCADSSPAGTACTISIGNLTVGSSGVQRFAVTAITPAAAGLASIANTATIRDDGNNSSAVVSANDTDTTPLVAQPDLRVSKSTPASQVDVGDTVVYTITTTVTGNQNATGIIVTETVPEGSTYNAAASAPTIWSCPDGSIENTVCTTSLGNQAVGSVIDVTFAVDIVAEPTTRRLENTVVVADDGTNGADPTPHNNRFIARTVFPSFYVPVMGLYQLLLLMLAMGGVGIWRQRR